MKSGIGWSSWGRKGVDDTRLIIAETAVDALSYAVLHGMKQNRFVSTAGALNPTQPDLLARAMKRLSECSEQAEIVLAVDNDEAGDRLCEQIEAIYRDCEPPGSILKVHRPEGRGEDWNDVLRASED